MIAQNRRWGLGHIQTCKSGPKGAALHEKKNKDKGWNPYRLVILVQITQFCMHKTTGETWDLWRLVILLQKSLFCMQKPQMRAGTNRN